MNKHLYKYLSVICIAMMLFTTACKDSGSPQSIAELFLMSINKLDFETANYVSTKNTKSFLKILDAESKGKFTPAQLEKRAENFEVKIISVVKDSDTTATVKFETKPKILPFEILHLHLVTEKLDKKSWKVNLSTVDIYDNDAGNRLNTNPDGSINTGQFHPEVDSVPAQE